MDEQDKIIQIWAPSKSDKLIVRRAASLENEIRFYINEGLYVVARDNKETILVKIKKEEVEVDKKDNKYISKSQLKRCIKENYKLLFQLLFIATVLFLISIYVIYISKNLLILIMMMNIDAFLLSISTVIICESGITESLKSKHSAEHMMVNFLEKNRRLPRSIEEVKKASRFTKECGTRGKVYRIVESFIYININFIFMCIAIVPQIKYSETRIIAFIFTITISIIGCVITILIEKYHKLDGIVNFLSKKMSLMIQCFNTTKNVNGNDILLAYYAANRWLKIVYPKFYTDLDETTFNSLKIS